MNWWINALFPSMIWLGGAGLFAYLKKPDNASILEVRTDLLGWLGGILVGAGFALHCWSVVVLARNLSEQGQAETLAETGPFRFVRNPIYLAGIIILTGIGFLYGPWHIINALLPVVLLVYFHLAVVRVEEPGLRQLFGANYVAYCQSVPRWFPRFTSVFWRGSRGQA